MSIVKKYMGLDGIDELRQFFIENGTLKRYKKDEFFIRRGQNNNSIGLIVGGGFRFVGYSSEGKEQIMGYSFENDFAVDYATFQIQTPSLIDIQSITDSDVLYLSYNGFNTFFENSGVSDLRSKIAECLLHDISVRLLSMYCDSPGERYTKLIARNPDLLRLVSLKEIASLIKITPETLSRIRKKLRALDLNQEY